MGYKEENSRFLCAIKNDSMNLTLSKAINAIHVAFSIALIGNVSADLLPQY